MSGGNEAGEGNARGRGGLSCMAEIKRDNMSMGGA